MARFGEMIGSTATQRAADRAQEGRSRHSQRGHQGRLCQSGVQDAAGLELPQHVVGVAQRARRLYGARLHGQTIYIDPKAEMVIARFASHPLAGNPNNDPIAAGLPRVGQTPAGQSAVGNAGSRALSASGEMKRYGSGSACRHVRKGQFIRACVPISGESAAIGRSRWSQAAQPMRRADDLARWRPSFGFDLTSRAQCQQSGRYGS